MKNGTNRFAGLPEQPDLGSVIFFVKNPLPSKEKLQENQTNKSSHFGGDLLHTNQSVDKSIHLCGLAPKSGCTKFTNDKLILVCTPNWLWLT